MSDPTTALLEKWCGPVIEPHAATAGKARDFAAFLAARDDVGATLIEVREGRERSWVVVEFELDVGQEPVVDIGRRERVSLGFPANDRDWPSALVVRDSFPDNLPHTFLVEEGDPALLCLSEEPWAEAKRRWSPNMLIRTVRHWFNETAKGALHKGDQALEPFVIGSVHQAILPADYAERCASATSHLYGYNIENTPIVRFFSERTDERKPAAFTAMHIVLPQQTHGFIRRSPNNVAELTRLFTVEGFDFQAVFGAKIRDWLKDKALRGTRPVIIVSVPTGRTPDAPQERTDTRLFMVQSTIRELGVALDLWTAMPDGTEGPNLCVSDPKFDGSVIPVLLWSTSTNITRERAAQFNGYDAPTGAKMLAIGGGALGSQVVGNLVRMGETITGVADHDLLLPHNLARHGFFEDNGVGFFKSQAVAGQANGFLVTPAETAAYTLDVLQPSGADAEGFEAALREAEVILDLAASVAVSRGLAIDADASGRRTAAFLSPTGHDLVVLVEDAARRVRLDELEMSYYAAVLADARLDGHLNRTDQVRYGQSCRDLSSGIEQAHVAINAGIAAKALRAAVTRQEAVATVWRTDPTTLEVRSIDLDLRPMHRFMAGEWSVFVRPGLLETISARRLERLPDETGGVLLGDFDTSRKIIYLVDALATPIDSREDRGSFVRGSYGLPQAVIDAEAKTLQMLRYAGEWHSHPDGYGVMPSTDDVGLYGFMAEQMAVEGYPPIMLIIGNNEFSLVVEEQRFPLDRLGER